MPSAGWENAVAAIADDPTVEEVILSGGDPLALPDRPLARILDAVGAIDHVARLRIHTRLPVVLPERVDHALLDVLGSVRQPLVLVLHANHAREIDADVRSAVAALGRCGALLLNQAVLLAGVNERVSALPDLGPRLGLPGAAGGSRAGGGAREGTHPPTPAVTVDPAPRRAVGADRNGDRGRSSVLVRTGEHAETAVEVVIDDQLDWPTADLAVDCQHAVHVGLEGHLERLVAARAVHLDPGDRLQDFHGASPGAGGRANPTPPYRV